MRIFCRICSREFQTDKPIEEAGRVLFGKMMIQHLAEHPAEARDKAIEVEAAHHLAAIYLLLEHVEIPPDETELHEWVDKVEEELAGMFGFTLKDAEEVETDVSAGAADGHNVTVMPG